MRKHTYKSKNNKNCYSSWHQNTRANKRRRLTEHDKYMKLNFLFSSLGWRAFHLLSSSTIPPAPSAAFILRNCLLEHDTRESFVKIIESWEKKEGCNAIKTGSWWSKKESPRAIFIMFLGAERNLIILGVASLHTSEVSGYENVNETSRLWGCCDKKEVKHAGWVT